MKTKLAWAQAESVPGTYVVIAARGARVYELLNYNHQPCKWTLFCRGVDFDRKLGEFGTAIEAQEFAEKHK